MDGVPTVVVWCPLYDWSCTRDTVHRAHTNAHSASEYINYSAPLITIIIQCASECASLYIGPVFAGPGLKYTYIIVNFFSFFRTCLPKSAEKKHHFIVHELLVCECGQELTQVHVHCIFVCGVIISEIVSYLCLNLYLACPSSASRNGLFKEI